jgi:hypothetical protein
MFFFCMSVVLEYQRFYILLFPFIGKLSYIARAKLESMKPCGFSHIEFLIYAQTLRPIPHPPPHALSSSIIKST